MSTPFILDDRVWDSYEWSTVTYREVLKENEVRPLIKLSELKKGKVMKGTRYTYDGQLWEVKSQDDTYTYSSRVENGKCKVGKPKRVKTELVAHLLPVELEAAVVEAAEDIMDVGTEYDSGIKTVGKVAFVSDTDPEVKGITDKIGTHPDWN